MASFIITCFSVQMCHLLVCNENKVLFLFFSSVNGGDYIKAVLDRNVAENISRVLYPNDNVRF